MSRQTELAWAAGIVDGEGHVGITKHHFVVIQLGMMDEAAIKKFWTIFRFLGSKSLYKSRVNKPIHKLQYSHNPSIIVLKQLLPYLVTKKDHALLAIEFSERKTKFKGGHANDKPTTDELILRDFYYKTMQTLTYRK